MVSCGIMSSGQAQTYYKDDYNYYANIEEESIYHGKLAQIEKLNNIEINQENFNETIKNTHNRGRAGIDLTFSAPKSVSILSLTTTDKELQNILIKAHQDATFKTMQYVENHLIYSRIQHNKSRELVKTDNINFASFNHYTTRENDPQLHTHNFIFNQTMCIDGKKRSIEANAILKNVKNLGKQYRLELSNNLLKNGIEIEITDNKNFFFEIKDFKQQTIDLFSKRRKQIIEKKVELEKTLTDKNTINELSNRLTKKAKQHISLNQTKENWNNEIKDNNIVIDKIKIDKNIINQDKIDFEKIINDKIEKITEFKSSFTDIEILNEVKQSVIQNTQIFNEKELLNIVNNNINIIKKDNQNVYTSKEIYKSEQQILNFAKNKKIHTEILKNELFNENLTKWELDNFRLNANQKEALKGIITQRDNVLIIQGDAGTGKTTLLKALNDINNKNNNKVIVGLSAEGKASKEIQDASGINSKTIDSFLLTKDFKEYQNSTLIVDEAGKTGTLKLQQLTKIADDYNMKIVLMGDTKQLASIQAGGIFSDLQNEKTIKTIHLKANIRQKDEKLKDIVNNLSTGNTEKAIDSLVNLNKINISKTDTIYNDITDYYMQNKGYKDTVIIASTNKDINVLNNQIKQELTKNNIISDKNFTISTLNNLNLSNYDKKQIQNYKANDIIIDNNKKLKIMGSFENQIIVKNLNTGKTESLTPQKNLQVFRETEKNFAQGEKITFLQNENKKLKVKNGEIGIIEKISKNKDNTYNLTVKINENNIIFFNSKDYNYMDYAYAITTTKSQGLTAEKAIILDNKYTDFNQKYVEISRAKKDIKIFTTDINNMKKQASIFKEQKTFNKSTELENFESNKVKNIFTPLPSPIPIQQKTIKKPDINLSI